MRIKVFLVIIVILFWFLAIIGCKQENNTTSTTLAGGAFTDIPLIPKPLNGNTNDDWLVKIDGMVITRSYFETNFNLYKKTAEYRYFFEQYLIKKGVKKLDEKKLAEYSREFDNEIKDEFLDNLIDRELLYKEAYKRKIYKTPEAIYKIKQDLMEILIAKEMGDEMPQVSEKEVAEYYNRHKKKFRKYPFKQAALIIKQNLIIQKLQTKQKMILRKLIKSLRDQTRIQKNTNIIK